MKNEELRTEDLPRALTAWQMLFVLGSLFFIFFSCSSHSDEVDRLNDLSYHYHYRDLDSARIYAERALAASDDYSDGRAEALNNLAFVSIARMDYDRAYRLLDSVALCTDNRVELLVADVQLMRLCQRMSRNKEFYDYHERAEQDICRINEEWEALPQRMRDRMIYARSEYAIVTSTYYYYVGLKLRFIEALDAIDPAGEIKNDTAQYVNYLYNIGSGGYITGSSVADIEQKEWEQLMLCYILSHRSGLVYWEANALQALSEHLIDEESRSRLVSANAASVNYINEDMMSDSLLAGYLAQRSLNMFISFGDVYQTAGAYRTLGSCHWAVGDNHSALVCFEDALFGDSAIHQAPDLIASIRERMSLTYAAMNDKENSDINRNCYLDIQEDTRQDRQLEARAEQLDRNSSTLNIMIIAVLVMIIAVIVSMFVFNYLNRKKDRHSKLDNLLEPLQRWQEDNARRMAALTERREEIGEAYAGSLLNIADNKRRNIENRAKIFLVNSALPLIDRLINEVSRLMKGHDPQEVRDARYAYIIELTDRINECNDVLTEWIKMRQGQLNLRIESFALQDILDIVKQGRMSFNLKGITLTVRDSDAIVKADKTLTLFMLNTIADNARKFTPEGGDVNIGAVTTDRYVEISVSDTGRGMSREQLDSLFNMNGARTSATTPSSGNEEKEQYHGFGLMNCKGIIEKYRKTGKLFDVCHIGAESEQGRGSRFFFRLPKGIMRIVALSALLNIASSSVSAATGNHEALAGACADSLYVCNVEGRYEEAAQWADSALTCLNNHYLALCPDGTVLISDTDDGGEPAEITWLHEGLPFDYDIILAVRNERAVAALALHDWPTYACNNDAYTRLYKELSADTSLDAYVTAMQRAETNKTVAVILLVLLLAILITAYYTLYYRHRIHFRFCVEQINAINDMLAADISDREKLGILTETYSMHNFPDSLKTIIEQIRTELENSVRLDDEHSLDIELAEDELHRAEYENQKLHVSNNIMDNCLSTLKHETMYYPSRIRRLLDGDEDNITAIDELARYYKQLYLLLCRQAMSQTAAVGFDSTAVSLDNINRTCSFTGDVSLAVRGDAVMMQYLFDILQHESGDKTVTANVRNKDDKYAVFDIDMPMLAHRDFFVPSVDNIPFLICRQIVREHCKDTSLHGCGIVAEPRREGGTTITITLII